MQRYSCHVYDFLRIFHACSDFVNDKVRYGLCICDSVRVHCRYCSALILIASKYGSWSSSPLSSIWDQCRRCYWWKYFIYHLCRDWDRVTQFLAPVHLFRVCAGGWDSRNLSKCLPCARDGNSWFMKSYGIAAHCCRKLFLARWLMDAFVKLNSAGCGWSHGTLVCSLCWLLARLASRAARTVTGEWFLHFWTFHLICTTYDKGGVFWNGVLAIVCVVQLVHMGEILLLLWMVLGVCGLQVTDWPLSGCLLSCRE